MRIVEPYPLTRTFKIKAEFDGSSLLSVLSSKFPFKPPKYWQQRIEQGYVDVDGSEGSADQVLRQGVIVGHYSPRVIEPAVPDEVEILFETEEYVFVYKPAPMPVHPGGRYNKNSLIGVLQQMGYDQLRLTHRLDAVTSGLMLFAKNKTFAKATMGEFSAGRVQKRYLAHVHGIPDKPEARIDVPIRRKKGFVFESAKHLNDSRPAVTDVMVRKVLSDNTTVVECNPVTGRTHQIRLHLKHWGYPIVDDPIYGPRGDDSGSTLQTGAISLISAALVMQDLGISFSLPQYRSLLGS